MLELVEPIADSGHRIDPVPSNVTQQVRQMVVGVEDRARASLRWDAGYCALAGAAALVFASPLGSHLGLSTWVVILLGAAIVVWAAFIRWLAVHPDWERATRFVASANAAAGTGIAIWAASHDGGAGVLLGFVALHVFGFTSHQLWTLARTEAR